MTRIELLQLVIAQARSNGFDFKRWHVTRLGLPWASAREALAVIDAERRYYALLFSHDFARAFWSAGEEMTLAVEAQTFQRRGPDGTVLTVTRKPYVRRRVRERAWQYHLKCMAVSEEPLRYIRRFVRVAEELELPPEPATPEMPIVIVDEEDLLPDDD